MRFSRFLGVTPPASFAYCPIWIATSYDACGFEEIDVPELFGARHLVLLRNFLGSLDNRPASDCKSVYHYMELYRMQHGGVIHTLNAYPEWDELRTLWGVAASAIRHDVKPWSWVHIGGSVAAETMDKTTWKMKRMDNVEGEFFFSMALNVIPGLGPKAIDVLARIYKSSLVLLAQAYEGCPSTSTPCCRTQCARHDLFLPGGETNSLADIELPNSAMTKRGRRRRIGPIASKKVYSAVRGILMPELQTKRKLTSPPPQ